MPVAFSHPDRIRDDGRCSHLDGVSWTLDDERAILVSLGEDGQGEVRSRKRCERVIRRESGASEKGSATGSDRDKQQQSPLCLQVCQLTAVVRIRSFHALYPARRHSARPCPPPALRTSRAQNARRARPGRRQTRSGLGHRPAAPGSGIAWIRMRRRPEDLGHGPWREWQQWRWRVRKTGPGL
jgi:hypothetical protein